MKTDTSYKLETFPLEGVVYEKQVGGKFPLCEA